MIDRWSKKIDIITSDFITSFGSLDSKKLNKKPDSDSWSIAQIINHLIITNESYYPMIDELKNDSFKIPLTGKIKFLVNFFGKLVLKTVQPDIKRKVKTFDIWKPPESDIPEDILEKFKHHQTELIKVISGCDNLLASKKVISSPVNRNMVYNLETAFDIIVAHEQRHYQQAKRILAIF